MYVIWVQNLIKLHQNIMQENYITVQFESTKQILRILKSEEYSNLLILVNFLPVV